MSCFVEQALPLMPAVNVRPPAAHPHAAAAPTGSPGHPHFCRTTSAFLRNYLRIPAEPVPSPLFISYLSLLLSVEIWGYRPTSPSPSAPLLRVAERCRER